MAGTSLSVRVSMVYDASIAAAVSASSTAGGCSEEKPGFAMSSTAPNPTITASQRAHGTASRSTSAESATMMHGERKSSAPASASGRKVSAL